jgi:hypothetical protein
MGCFSYIKDKIWQLFGWNRKKVGPAAETSMDFPGIDPKDLELKVVRHKPFYTPAIYL